MLRGSEYAKLVLEDRERECKKRKELEEAKCANKKKKQQETVEMYKIQESRIAKENRQRNEVQSLKTTLVSEALYYLLENSLPKGLDSEDKDVMKRGIVDKFVREHGAGKLISDFKHKSYLLSEYARNIEETVKLALEAKKKCKDEDAVVDLDDELKDDFYNNLKTDDAEELTDVVRTRTMNAIDTFMTANANDKLEIQDIVRQTTEKVNANTNKEEIKECYNRTGKRAITEVRNRKVRNVFETMVYNVSNAAFKNESMKEIFVNESGLDINKVVENVEVLYTFLEMVNSAKIINVDSKYISNMLNGLK